jgi:hypothetical protein
MTTRIRLMVEAVEPDDVGMPRVVPCSTLEIHISIGELFLILSAPVARRLLDHLEPVLEATAPQP